VNTLKQEKKELVLNLLTEGNSIRGVERITGIHRETIIRLIRTIGENCERFLDEKMRNLNANYIQADELHTRVFRSEWNIPAEEKNSEIGSLWVFIAIDAETKLVPCYVVGKRTEENAYNFLLDLESRIASDFQLTTDAFAAYHNVDTTRLRRKASYAQLIKVFKEQKKDAKTGYSPSTLVKQIPSIIFGKPDAKHISTSHVERQNLTIRTQMRRFTRLTNAFSKKYDCLKRAMAIHFYWYNFIRIHETLRVTPAMEAGISEKIESWQRVM